MISVCIATYNGEPFIAAQLESIVAQLSPDDEIIISDDGSTDRTLEVVQALDYPCVRILHHEGEHGYVSNFENALRAARGDVIFLSDQDDLWKPGKVERCCEALKEVDLVVSDACLTDADGKEIAPSFFALRKPKQGLAGNLVKFGYLGCCMAFRRHVLTKALPFPPNRKFCTHDNWLMLVAEAFFKTRVLNELLVAYRRHTENASLGSENAHRSALHRISYRLYLLFHLLRRCGR